MELLNNVTSAGRGSFKVDILAKRVGEILASPFGCAFFTNAGEFGYLPEDLANPAVSMPLAAEAVGYVEKWNADHEADVEKALGLAPVIRPLVEATLAHDGTAWWYEPLAPERQVWVAHDGETPEPTRIGNDPNSPPSRWERYAQKPLRTAIYDYPASRIRIAADRLRESCRRPVAAELAAAMLGDADAGGCEGVRTQRTGGLAPPVRCVSGA